MKRCVAAIRSRREQAVRASQRVIGLDAGSDWTTQDVTHRMHTSSGTRFRLSRETSSAIRVTTRRKAGGGRTYMPVGGL
jgi:hypothetical protein